jgi:hypothetical protein
MSKRRGGVGVATCGGYLYAVGGHEKFILIYKFIAISELDGNETYFKSSGLTATI